MPIVVRSSNGLRPGSKPGPRNDPRSSSSPSRAAASTRRPQPRCCSLGCKTPRRTSRNMYLRSAEFREAPSERPSSRRSTARLSRTPPRDRRKIAEARNLQRLRCQIQSLRGNRTIAQGLRRCSGKCVMSCRTTIYRRSSRRSFRRSSAPALSAPRRWRQALKNRCAPDTAKPRRNSAILSSITGRRPAARRPWCSTRPGSKPASARRSPPSRCMAAAINPSIRFPTSTCPGARLPRQTPRATQGRTFRPNKSRSWTRPSTALDFH